MDRMNIYLCGVGGQGIGLLSEVMIRSAMAAGYPVMGADTHGLAQRGGTVSSHLRIGDGIFTPLVPQGEADVVVALERMEGTRGMVKMLRKGGTLIYYDTSYQPISVRTGLEKYPSGDDVEAMAAKIDVKVLSVCFPDLPDPRMQNVALLGRIAASGIIEGYTPELIEGVLKEVVPAKVLEGNLEVFKNAVTGDGCVCTG